MSSTTCSANYLDRNGLDVELFFKVCEGRPNVVDEIKNGRINLVINTPMGARSRFDEEAIGCACIQYGILAITTLSGANAILRAIRSKQKPLQLNSLQNYHA